MRQIKIKKIQTIKKLNLMKMYNNYQLMNIINNCQIMKIINNIQILKLLNNKIKIIMNFKKKMKKNIKVNL